MTYYKAKYEKYKRKYLAIKNKSDPSDLPGNISENVNNLSGGGGQYTLALKIYPHTNNRKNIPSANSINSLHITICSLAGKGRYRTTKTERQNILRDVVSKYKKYFGRKNIYNLYFSRWKGGNSLKIKTYDPKKNVGVAKLRDEMIRYIRSKYPNAIDTSRGNLPLHIDTKRDHGYIGDKYQVTYAIYLD